MSHLFNKGANPTGNNYIKQQSVCMLLSGIALSVRRHY